MRAVQKFVFILVNDETGCLNLIFPLLNFSAHVCSATPLQKRLDPAEGLSCFLVLWLTREPEDICLVLSLESHGQEHPWVIARQEQDGSSLPVLVPGLAHSHVAE